MIILINNRVRRWGSFGAVEHVDIFAHVLGPPVQIVGKHVPVVHDRLLQLRAVGPEVDVQHLGAVHRAPLDAEIVPVASGILVEFLLQLLESGRSFFIVEEAAEKGKL